MKAVRAECRLALGSRLPFDGGRWIIWETGIEGIWGSVCGLYRVSQLLLQASRRKMLIDPIMTFVAKLAPNVFDGSALSASGQFKCAFDRGHIYLVYGVDRRRISQAFRPNTGFAGRWCLPNAATFS